MSTGLTLRHEGQDAVIAADVAPHRGFKVYVTRAVDALVNLCGDFTVDDVRRLAYEIANTEGDQVGPHSPNLIPAVIGGYAAAGRIVRITEYHSGRKSRRYGRNGVYRAS